VERILVADKLIAAVVDILLEEHRILAEVELGSLVVVVDNPVEDILVVEDNLLQVGKLVVEQLLDMTDIVPLDNLGLQVELDIQMQADKEQNLDRL